MGWYKKYFNRELSNQEGNVVLGSSQANKNHEHYEKNNYFSK